MKKIHAFFLNVHSPSRCGSRSHNPFIPLFVGAALALSSSLLVAVPAAGAKPGVKPEVKPGAATRSTALPPFVDNSTLPCFPPVTSQGPTGACSVFAACYYQMTHMAGLANHYNNKTSRSAVFAPNWTMNFGVGGLGCYDLARKNGCASWDDLPFTPEPGVWSTDPGVWARALVHRVDQQGSIGNVDKPEGFQRMKELLSQGYVLYFDTWIGSFQFKKAGDDPATNKDDPFIGKNVIWGLDNYVAGHALAIVGYNDYMWVDINGNNKVEPAEKGAIKIVNSWGQGYEDRGFTYIAYDALSEISKVPGVPEKRRKGSAFCNNTAYWVTFKADYYPRLLARITLNTSRRNQLQVQLGHSSTTEKTPTVTWASYLLNKQGGAVGFDGKDNAGDGTFVLDFTDLITDKKLEDSGSGRWYVSVTDTTADDHPALLKAFTLIDNITKKSFKSSLTTPLSADGNTVHAWVDYSLKRPIDTKPPTPPQNLVVKNSFSNMATLSWAASKDDVAIKHYKVFRNRKALLTTDKTSITEINLPLGDYVYNIAAVDTSNNLSKVSNAVTVRVTKSAPFDTTATYKLINKKSGKVLAAAQGTYQPGVPFVQYTYSNQASQHFKLADAGDGSYRIRTMPGEMLVQVDSLAMNDGARVCQWSDNGSDSCKWIMIPAGGDSYKIANKNSSKVLAVIDGSSAESAQMEQTTFSNNDSQLWRIEKVAK